MLAERELELSMPVITIIRSLQVQASPLFFLLSISPPLLFYSVARPYHVRPSGTQIGIPLPDYPNYT